MSMWEVGTNRAWLPRVQEQSELRFLMKGTATYGDSQELIFEVLSELLSGSVRVSVHRQNGCWQW
jgi:hypothetical protein